MTHQTKEQSRKRKGDMKNNRKQANTHTREAGFVLQPDRNFNGWYYSYAFCCLPFGYIPQIVVLTTQFKICAIIR